jgi:hypothetical protein
MKQTITIGLVVLGVLLIGCDGPSGSVSAVPPASGTTTEQALCSTIGLGLDAEAIADAGKKHYTKPIKKRLLAEIDAVVRDKSSGVTLSLDGTTLQLDIISGTVANVAQDLANLEADCRTIT